MGAQLLCGLLYALCCALLQALFKSGDAATGIEDSLLAGIERMADRANLNEERSTLDGRASRENLAATTGHLGLHICGMYLWLHSHFLLAGSDPLRSEAGW
jgi:hypothetical protein